MKTTNNGILVPIQTGHKLPPMFFIHGLFGGTRTFENMAPMIDPEQTVYGLNAIGLQDDQEADQTIEAMARRYVQVIREVQPFGPYFLGGFCYGGVVGYEIARQLDAQGEKIALLAIIEGSALVEAARQDLQKPVSIFHPQRRELIAQTLPYFLSGYRAFGGWRLNKRLSKRVLQLLGRHQLPEAGTGGSIKRDAEYNDFLYDDSEEGARLRERYRHIRQSLFRATPSENQLRIEEVNRRALSNYVPKSFGGQITLLIARHRPIGRILLGPLDPTFGWGSLAAGISTRFVEGTHSGCLRLPFVTTLAAELRAALHEAKQGYGIVA